MEKKPRYPGILATGSYSPLTGKTYQTSSTIACFFLSLVGRMPFFFLLAWARTSNSCVADEENSRKAKAETMRVPQSARCPVEVGLPTSRLLGWRSTNWAIDSLALVSANLLCNVLTYFSTAARQQIPFCMCWRVCFSARAASVLDSLLAELTLEDSGGTIST